LEAELEQVGGQTVVELHDTCEAEYKFLDKLENQLSKNKEFDKKKVDEIKKEAKKLMNMLSNCTDDADKPKSNYTEATNKNILVRIKE